MAAEDGRRVRAHPPEEPPLVELPSGVRHPPPIRAAAFLGLVKAGEALDRGLDADLHQAHGLSLRAFEVLLHLAAFAPQGRLRISALVEQAPLSQSRVSRLVAELEARGLVARETATGDSRGVEVSITDRGLEKLLEAQDTHFASLDDRFFSRLDWSEIVFLARITAKLVSQRDERAPQPSSEPASPGGERRRGRQRNTAS
jgi:DNA-binding MarR family transcriptional regulator